jgi:hypothetical protein
MPNARPAQAADLASLLELFASQKVSVSTEPLAQPRPATSDIGATAFRCHNEPADALTES